MTSPNTALSTRRDAATAILAAVEKREAEIVALAGRGAEATQFYAALKLYFARNPKVLDCTPSSVAVSMLRVAQTGLTLGATCDILPFGTEALFSARYTGLVQLALASGTRSLNADVVREGEFWQAQKGTEFYLRHRKDDLDTGRPLALPGAKIIHAYAIAELKPGSFVFESNTRDELDKVRLKYSKQWAKGPLDDYPWWAKKRMVRVLAPYLPQNPRFAAALQYVAQEEEAIVDGEFEIPPVRIDENGEEIAA